MLKEETDLRNEYTKLTAGAKITYEGKEYNLAAWPFHNNENEMLGRPQSRLDFNGSARILKL